MRSGWNRPLLVTLCGHSILCSFSIQIGSLGALIPGTLAQFFAIVFQGLFLDSLDSFLPELSNTFIFDKRRKARIKILFTKEKIGRKSSNNISIQ